MLPVSSEERATAAISSRHYLLVGKTLMLFSQQTSELRAKLGSVLGVSLMCNSALRRIPKNAAARFNLVPFRMLEPLPPEEKLAALQAMDPRRRWASLDDQRVCVLCDRVITGRQIEVSCSSDGVCSARCPTPGCPALPSDWFYRGTGHSSNAATIRMGEASLWGH